MLSRQAKPADDAAALNLLKSIPLSAEVVTKMDFCLTF
jgi:hypothetical protein